MKAILCLFLLISGGYFIQKHFNTQKPSSQDTLTIGIAAGYAPFVSINEKGEYEGFDIDVAHALAANLHKKLVLKDMGSMTSLFMALDQGLIDAIMWGISITQERCAQYSLVHYHGEKITSYPLIFWQSIPSGIKTLDDMKGMTVCVEPGSCQSAIVSDYPLITLLPTDKVDDALLNIQYKKADAALVESAIARKFKEKCPEIKTLDIPIASAHHELGVGIVIKKDNTDLLKAVQRAVLLLKKAGIIARYAQKWNIDEQP